jgi:hypothetical protein
MLLGKLLLKQCMLKENKVKVKLSQRLKEMMFKM